MRERGASAWAPWSYRLSDLGYASAVYDAVFGPPSPRDSLSAQAHRALWTRIVDRDLPAGGRFFEDDAAAWVGVSRLPVREAIARLVEDGLLVRTGRGIRVRVFRPDELRTLYEYRALLEGHAARSAAATIAAEDVEVVRADQDALRVELGRQDGRCVVDLVLADLRLHDRVLDLCGNAYVVGAMRRIRGQLSLFQTEGLRLQRDVDAVLDEHEAVLTALASGDGWAAAAAMERHVLAASERVRTMLAAEDA